MVRLLFEPSGGFILETATAYWSIDFVFGHMIYPIPFDLGSQDDSSQASSTPIECLVPLIQTFRADARAADNTRCTS